MIKLGYWVSIRGVQSISLMHCSCILRTHTAHDVISSFILRKRCGHLAPVLCCVMIVSDDGIDSDSDSDSGYSEF